MLSAIKDSLVGVPEAGTYECQFVLVVGGTFCACLHFQVAAGILAGHDADVVLVRLDVEARLQRTLAVLAVVGKSL